MILWLYSHIILYFLIINFNAASFILSDLCKSVGAAPYTLREGTEYCYRYVEVALDFSSANRSCVRDKAALVSIRSASEDSYINETYYNNINDFWIGLSDQASEGTFRYKQYACMHAYTGDSWLYFDAIVHNCMCNNIGIYYLDGLMEVVS